MAYEYSLDLFDECIKKNRISYPPSNVIHTIQTLGDQLRGNSSNAFNRPQRFIPRSSSATATHISKPAWGSKTQVVPNSVSVATPKPYNPTHTILGNVTTGFESQLLLIRTYLNKTTDKTKSDMQTKITNILSQIIHDDMVPENMTRLSETIYQISSANKFYSKLFAIMYIELVSQFPQLNTELEKKLEQFLDMSLLNDIAINTNSTPYEQMCKNNKKNDTIKADITFLSNVSLLLKHSLRHNQTVLKNLAEKMKTSKMDASSKAMNDELVEYMYILFKALHPWEEKSAGVYPSIVELSKCKSKECPGLSSKTIFKCMEMIEM